MGYAEDFLDQIVVDDHDKKGACGDHRVNRTKMACSSPRAYMTGQHFNLLLQISPKTALGEFLIAQRAVKKAACHGSVVICPVRRISAIATSSSRKLLSDCSNSRTRRFRPRRSTRSDNAAQKRPSLVRKRRKLSASSTPSSPGDLARAGAVKTSFGKQFHRDFEELFPVVWRGQVA